MTINLRWPWLELKRTQTEGVSYDRDRTKTHGGAGDCRAEQQSEKRIEHSGSDGNSECVIKKREQQILFDVADGGTAEFACAQNSAQIAFKQSDARAFDGHVGAGAHGDANIGCGQRGRVVYSVASHGNDA